MSVTKRALRFDVYPAATPTSGRLAQIARPLKGSGFRVELDGLGKGTLVIDRNDAQCTAANFNDGNYVDMVDTVLNKSLGGWFMQPGTAKLLSANEKGDQFLTIEGPGQLSYLGKCEWLPIAYVAPGGGTGVGNATNSPRDDGQWHWPNNRYGSILERAVLEAQDPDRPDDEIPALSIDFNYTHDSIGTNFTAFAGDYTQGIGVNYLDTVADLIRLGLSIRIKPNFTLQCFQNDVGTDRHSTTFGAGKVRFVGGVNIAADLMRTLNPGVRIKTLVVKGISSKPADYVIVTDAGGTGEAFLEYAVSDDPTILTDAGNKNLALRRAQTDTARFPIVGGTDPLNGHYRASWPGDGGDYWLGDTVTIHTGTGEIDYNNVSLRVAAIEWQMDDVGLFDEWVELGSTFYDFSRGADIPGATAPPGPCNCGPTPGPTCIPDSAFITTLVDWDFSVCGVPASSLPANPCGAIGGWASGAYIPGADPTGLGYSGCGVVLNHDGGSRAFPVTAGQLVSCTATILAFNSVGQLRLTFFDGSCAPIGSDIEGAEVPLPSGSVTYDVAVSGIAPAGAIGAHVQVWTGTIAHGGVPFTGGLVHFVATGSSGSDPLCVPALIYGDAYDPSTALPGSYLPFGATVPAPLEVAEVDGSPDVLHVRKIVVPNGSLTDDGSGQVTFTYPSITFASPGNSAVGDTAAAGSASTAARSDHRHGRESFGSPGGSAVGDTTSAGSATTVAHSDHRHAREAFGSPVAIGGANADGAATTVARSDHVHAGAVTAAQVRDAGRWEPIIDSDGSLVLDGATPPNVTMDWTT